MRFRHVIGMTPTFAPKFAAGIEAMPDRDRRHLVGASSAIFSHRIKFVEWNIYQGVDGAATSRPAIAEPAYSVPPVFSQCRHGQQPFFALSEIPRKYRHTSCVLLFSGGAGKPQVVAAFRSKPGERRASSLRRVTEQISQPRRRANKELWCTAVAKQSAALSPQAVMSQPLSMLLDILKNQNRQKSEQANQDRRSPINRTPPRGPRPVKGQ
jgi:hypothetical protein